MNVGTVCVQRFDRAESHPLGELLRIHAIEELADGLLEMPGQTE
jgi:hypothetical protein